MATKKRKHVPSRIQSKLPRHAEDIYEKAYGNAEKRYQDPSKRRSKSDKPRQVAGKVAWSAVEKEYQKDKSTGQWKPKKGATKKAKENK
jgi:cation transport regulator